MSYDDKDRHKVAARLRSKRPEEFGPRYERNVLEHIFHSLFPKQVYPVSNWVLRTPYTLADLIDRPTCRDVGDFDHEAFKCSRCGYRVLSLRGIANGSPSDAVLVTPDGLITEFAYCPNCGAEVTDGD